MTNPCAKRRTQDEPYEVWRTPDGTWEWRVLKKYQMDDAKPGARWFCAVRSPHTFDDWELGDTYVRDVKVRAVRVDAQPRAFTAVDTRRN